jgi:hypothetical protein
MSSARLGPESDGAGKGPRSSYTIKLQTRLLIREGSSQHENRKYPTDNKNFVVGLRWVPDTKTDWPTDRQVQNNFDYALLNILILQQTNSVA